MIPVKVDQLFLSNLGFVVLLKPEDDSRSLPIFIGAAEAQAIAIHINKVDIPRPLTHDLMKNLLDLLECRVKRVEVCDLQEGTFFAALICEREGREMRVDCRPSDGIAVALRTRAPLFVAEAVMKEAGRNVELDEETSGQPGSTVKPHRDLTPLELLEKKLEKAVEEERYEDAARLRDDIKRLKGSHTPN